MDRRLVSPITDVFMQQVVKSNALISSLGKLNAGCKLMTRAFELKAGYMELMGSILKTVFPQVTSESTKQLGEPPSESAKPAPTPFVLGGPNEESVDQEPAEIVDDNAVSNDADTETPPIRRIVSLSANPIHEG